MTTQLLGVSVSGLRVAQSNLSVTGHNIANAGVDGYSRQVVNAETNISTFNGAGYVGSGVTVQSIERVANQFVTEQVRTDSSLFKDLEAYNDNISQLDRLLSDASTGLASGLESFFASMQNGADDPTSIPARQLIVSEAENLSDRFNTIYDRLDIISGGVDDFINSAVSQVNALVSNIAQLNARVSDAIGAGNGALPNDLLDQRDEAIRGLTELIGIQTYEQGFGQVNIVMNSGQNLVVGTEARQLSLVTSDADASKSDIVFDNGDNNIIVTDQISGGELGGLLRFQNGIMDQTYNELGRIAVVMADSFNDLHGQGINLNNEFGGNFFYDVNETSIARNRVISNTNNTPPNDRLMSLNIVDSAQLSANNYDVNMAPGGLFQITNSESGVEVATGVLTGVLPQSVTFDGLELVFESGSFQTDDSFRLLPVKSGARDLSSELLDASSLAFGSPLVADASIGNVGTGTVSQGEVISLEDIDGNPLPLFATPGQMSPPLIVRFNSDTSYDILDNSDPGNPAALVPPVTNQRFVVGVNNELFGSDPGETLVQSRGDLIGLPAGRVPVVGGGTVTNGYPAEAFTLTQAASTPGGEPSSVNVFSNINASARETASLLNNVDGVNASASTYIEISNVQGLSGSAPLQITLNGEDLLEYEFDSGSGTFVVAANVPDPSVSEDAFNDYLADQINGNAAFSDRGIYAVSGTNAITGNSELRVFSSEGDDFDLTLEADATGPDTLNVSDGKNAPLALIGNGVGVTSAISVGGSIDVRLADGVTMEAFPPDSLLFGDTTAADFATSTYLGIQASIQGVPKAGDTFTFDFNADAASDNRNALALSALQNSGTVDDGTQSYSDAYGVLVETIGIDTASSKVNRDASEQVLQESTKLRDSISAVNLDEEAANLIKFEQMFSANAQVISVARDLFDRLISSF